MSENLEVLLDGGEYGGKVKLMNYSPDLFSDKSVGWLGSFKLQHSA